jgi:hypothetical protein
MKIAFPLSSPEASGGEQVFCGLEGVLDEKPQTILTSTVSFFTPNSSKLVKVVS